MNLQCMRRARARRRSAYFWCVSFVALVLGAGAFPALAEVAVDAPLANVDALLREAAQHNPSVRAAREAWTAEGSRARAAGKLPDPRITYGNFLQPIETRIGAQAHQLALSQTLPWFGSLGRERAVVRTAAEAKWAELADTWLTVELRTTRALHELHRLDLTLAIHREAFALLQQFEAVAQARLRTNRAGSADVLRLQLELGRTEDRLRQLRDLRAPAVARLNALLDRAAATPFPATVPLREWEAPAIVDSLERRLLATHPRLMALRAQVERQGRLADVARDQGRPDLTLGVMHTFVDPRDDVDMADNGNDATLATVSIRVPLWRGKVAAGVQAAREQRAAHEATLRAVSNELTADLREALFAYEDGARRVALYRGTLVPKAEESLGATLDAYANGSVDFGELIDVQQVLLEFQLLLLEAQVDRANARARIESLCPDPTALRDVLDLQLALQEDQR